MKKIMFNDRFGLTQAVLEGRKTQTRRIIPLKYRDKEYLDYAASDFGSRSSVIIDNYARYKIGEIVAVAQSYNDVLDYSNKVKDLNIWANIIANDFTGKQGKAFTNKMFVEAEFMPHKIQITNVRVQRLQDISDEDCLKEGVLLINDKDNCFGFNGKYELPNSFKIYDSPQEAYARLIGGIYSNGTWDSNPYVFVYDFELCSL